MGAVIEHFDKAFRSIDQRSRSLIEAVPFEMLFRRPANDTRLYATSSVGECVLRSAAMVEMTFGGITTRLWDDPFEWTLPEKLSTKDAINEYLDETEATRRKGFGYFMADDDLLRAIPSPVALRSVLEIFLDTLARSEHYQGKATAIFEILTGRSLGRR